MNNTSTRLLRLVWWCLGAALVTVIVYVALRPAETSG